MLARQVGGDEPVAIRGVGDGVEAGLFAGQFAAELDQAATELLQGQHGVGGRRPRARTPCAARNSRMPSGIDRVGLGAGQPGALEVFDRPRIDDHDFHALGPVQGERQAQAVNAGGFQAHAGVAPRRVSSLRSCAVAGGRVGQGAGAFGLAVAQEGHDQFTGADIKAGADFGVCFGLFHAVGLGLVLEPSGSRPRAHVLDRPCQCRLAAAATRRWPQILSGVDKRSRGTDLTNRVAAGRITPPCPQASAASRRGLHPPKFPPARTSRCAHEREIQGD